MGVSVSKLGINVSKVPWGPGTGTPRGWNRRGVVLTLDALGTLYRFREPVAKQYMDVARACGLKTEIQQSDLEASFKKAFMALSKQHPNYGKGTLPNPEAWWSGLVQRTFEGLVEEPLPSNLGSKLYERFSSSAAYEHFTDLHPFFNELGDLRKRYSGPDDPVLIVGLLTNSDPRVRRVLEDFDLDVGAGEVWLKMAEKQIGSGRTERGTYASIRPKDFLSGFYNEENDFDFVITSYEAGYEKPDLKIFRLAGLVPPAIQPAVVPSTKKITVGPIRRDEPGRDEPGDVSVRRIHVGDEYEKDILDVNSHILIDRDGKWDPTRNPKVITVRSLEEVAATVAMLLDEAVRKGAP